jgi:hypothetical protein
MPCAARPEPDCARRSRRRPANSQLGGEPCPRYGCPGAPGSLVGNRFVDSAEGHHPRAPHPRRPRSCSRAVRGPRPSESLRSCARRPSAVRFCSPRPWSRCSGRTPRLPTPTARCASSQSVPRHSTSTCREAPGPATDCSRSSSSSSSASSSNTYKNSLHEGYDGLNGLEKGFAYALDRLGSPWCRNPSRSGYVIPLITPGTTSTFYPDFLVWQDSCVFAIDTTGGHLLAEKAARRASRCGNSAPTKSGGPSMSTTSTPQSPGRLAHPARKTAIGDLGIRAVRSNAMTRHQPAPLA